MDERTILNEKAEALIRDKLKDKADKVFESVALDRFKMAVLAAILGPEGWAAFWQAYKAAIDKDVGEMLRPKDGGAFD